MCFAVVSMRLMQPLPHPVLPSNGLMQPLHSRSHAVILALELRLEGQVILAVLGGATELLSEGGGLKEAHLITIIV